MLKQKLSNLLTWSQLFNIWQLLFVCVIQRKTIHLCFFSVHELYLDQNCWVFWSWIAHRVPRCPQDRCSHPNHSERWGSHLHTHSTHFTSLYYLFIFVYLKFTKSYYLQATRKLFFVFLMKWIKLLVDSRMETCSLLFLQRRLAGGGTLETCCHDNLSCGHRDNSWRALRCSGNSKSGFLDDLLWTVRSCRRSSIFIWFPLHCALCQTAGGEMGAKLRIKLFRPTLGSLCTCDDTDESHVLWPFIW